MCHLVSICVVGVSWVAYVTNVIIVSGVSVASEKCDNLKIVLAVTQYIVGKTRVASIRGAA